MKEEKKDTAVVKSMVEQSNVDVKIGAQDKLIKDLVAQLEEMKKNI